MKCMITIFCLWIFLTTLSAQIPAPDTLNKFSGQIELDQGSIRFLKIDSPVFVWDLQPALNQLNLINGSEDRLFQINTNGNASLGDTLDDNNRFKLTLNSPTDGEDFYSVAGPNPAAMLRLVELQETKFGRIHFNNKNAQEYWQFQARSSNENPEIRFYWSGDKDPENTNYVDLPSHTILGITPGKVTINGDEPKANLHIKQSPPWRHSTPTIDDTGLALENSDGTALWKFQVGIDDLALIFNDTHMGSFSASSGFYNPSDRRLKNSLESIDASLDQIMHLRPYSYYYNHDQKTKNKSFGFIAQEVMELFPDLVIQNQVNDYLMINYDQFIPLLTKSIQELKTIIDLQQ